MDFQRGFFTLNDKGEPCVQSTGSQGSGILSSLALANCFIILPAVSGSIAAGEKVTIELFDHFLGGI
jgi:molybdopterin molybdotransferase